MLDIAFVVSGCPHGDIDDIPHADIVAALEKRLNYIKTNPADFREAIGHCDTYEESE